MKSQLLLSLLVFLFIATRINSQTSSNKEKYDLYVKKCYENFIKCPTLKKCENNGNNNNTTPCQGDDATCGSFCSTNCPTYCGSNEVKEPPVPEGLDSNGMPITDRLSFIGNYALETVLFMANDNQEDSTLLTIKEGFQASNFANIKARHPDDPIVFVDNYEVNSIENDFPGPLLLLSTLDETLNGQETKSIRSPRLLFDWKRSQELNKKYPIHNIMMRFPLKSNINTRKKQYPIAGSKYKRNKKNANKKRDDQGGPIPPTEQEPKKYVDFYNDYSICLALQKSTFDGADYTNSLALPLLNERIKSLNPDCGLTFAVGMTLSNVMDSEFSGLPGSKLPLIQLHEMVLRDLAAHTTSNCFYLCTISDFTTTAKQLSCCYRACSDCGYYNLITFSDCTFNGKFGSSEETVGCFLNADYLAQSCYGFYLNSNSTYRATCTANDDGTPREASRTCYEFATQNCEFGDGYRNCTERMIDCCFDSKNTITDCIDKYLTVPNTQRKPILQQQQQPQQQPKFENVPNKKAVITSIPTTIPTSSIFYNPSPKDNIIRTCSGLGYKQFVDDAQQKLINSINALRVNGFACPGSSTANTAQPLQYSKVLEDMAKLHNRNQAIQIATGHYGAYNGGFINGQRIYCNGLNSTSGCASGLAIAGNCDCTLNVRSRYETVKSTLNTENMTEPFEFERFGEIVTYHCDPTDALNAWKASSGHCKVLLDQPNTRTHIGCSIVYGNRKVPTPRPSTFFCCYATCVLSTFETFS